MIPAEPPRAVLDTNVVLDLLVWQNPEAAPLRDAVLQGRMTCLADAEGLAELERVLAYPKLGLDRDAQVRIHAWYAALVSCPPAEAFFEIIPRCSDRDDQKFLELAVRQRADILISRDKALLRLARRIRRIAPQLDIVTPTEWMAQHVVDHRQHGLSVQADAEEVGVRRSGRRQKNLPDADLPLTELDLAARFTRKGP